MFKATLSVISTLLLTYNSIYTNKVERHMMKKRQISFLCFFNGFLHQPAQNLINDLNYLFNGKFH